jgi:hypothetical protein
MALDIQISPTPGTALTPSAPFNLTVTVAGAPTASGVGALGSAEHGDDLGGQSFSGAGPYVFSGTAPASGLVWLTLAAAAAGVFGGKVAAWPVAPKTSGFDWLESQVFAHAAAVWPSLGTWSPRAGQDVAPPPLIYSNAEHAPAVGAPYLEIRFVWTSRVQTGVRPLETYQGEGLLQHDIYVEGGSGTAGLAVLTDRIEPMWHDASIPGLSFYNAFPPRDVQAPDGWAARQVDIDFHWEWSPSG